MQSNYIPLSDVVNSYLNEAELSPDDNFVRLYRVALEGLKLELLNDFAAPVKTVELTVLANKTAILPKDFINYSRLGIVNNSGVIATLTQNENLTFNKSCSDDRVDQPVAYQTILNGNQYLYWASASPIGFAYQPLYGLGSNVNLGEFRIDPKGGKIVFDFRFHYEKVVLEYLSVGSLDDGNYYCDSQLENAVKAYIYWATMRHKKNFSLNEKQVAKHNFYAERKLAMMRMSPVNVTQVNEQILKGTFLAAKQ